MKRKNFFFPWSCRKSKPNEFIKKFGVKTLKVRNCVKNVKKYIFFRTKKCKNYMFIHCNIHF